MKTKISIENYTCYLIKKKIVDDKINAATNEAITVHNPIFISNLSSNLFKIPIIIKPPTKVNNRNERIYTPMKKPSIPYCPSARHIVGIKVNKKIIPIDFFMVIFVCVQESKCLKSSIYLEIP